MNICRSPAIASTLAAAAQGDPACPPISVDSAGTQARPGLPRCAVSLNAVSAQSTGFSRQLTPTDLTTADLIITAGRDNAKRVIQANPAARLRVFTLSAAASLADWVVNQGTLYVAVQRARGEEVLPDRAVPQSLADPLPTENTARLKWLVAEMESSRGLAGSAAAADEKLDPSELPDPHILGAHWHERNAPAILEMVNRLSAAARVVLGVQP